ncbi:YwmB family TATA-box binding protein [Radiobacillus kanasensis]|uniref:YwmB family TATA-box binding protein n=1 Tax=Radiobacillus kanasensis TaxID=2844358 RepID=UPI001E33949C|nr:YwmB family TATA-box binding protein [Radiobacillus kanasensis]UFT98934.1 YwmB family TATA-box binding protein [Radiobacillus kanasensis]
MKSRFILVPTIILVGIVCSFSSLKSAASTSHLSELEDMIEIVQAEELGIQKWEVLMKESLSRVDYQQTLQMLQTELSSFAYSVEEEEKAIKYIWSNPHKAHQGTERFIMLVPKEQKHDIQMTYVVSGTDWKKSTNTYYSNIMDNMLNVVFSEKMSKYTCLTTLSSDKINSDYFFDILKEKLKVQPLENMKENDFEVLSGYTPHWNSSIPITDGPMNVQVAARTGLGGKTTITIGTPIITTEY